MLLNLMSSNEFNLSKSVNSGFNKIKNLSTFQKYITYFWILGPFLYLLERDPADLWLTFLSVSFLFRCLIKRDWIWVGQLWFLFAIFLWITGICSALAGPYSNYSFFEAIIWIRFPIYAAAAQIWIGKDSDIRNVMFLSIFTGMLIMCLILTFEVLIEGPKDRLMWPYGDLVPGSYLSKVSLPIYCTLIAIISYKFNKRSLFNFFSVIISIILIFLSGERVNFLIRFFSGVFAIFSWRVDKIKAIKSFLVFCGICILILIAIFNFNKSQFDRYTNHFYKAIPLINISDDNGYWGAWRSGIQQGLYKPLIGLGPSSSRKHCKNMPDEDFKWLPGKNYCGNHPHNFYIQLFAETGIIGLIFGFLMFFYLFKTCYDGRSYNSNCPILAICYIIPLAFFFPIQQTGSFFGQWNNLFIWFPIGFCIAQIQNYKSIFKKQ